MSKNYLKLKSLAKIHTHTHTLYHCSENFIQRFAFQEVTANFGTPLRSTYVLTAVMK